MQKLKVAIAGFGVEGRSNFRYWSELRADITIVDERNDVEDLPEGTPAILGEGAFGKLQDFDLVVRTASLNPNHIKTNGKIWSATNEFFAKCPAPIIGVTGTKGKGTTATLISHILEAAGFKTWLVGNIGKPAIDVLAEIEEYEKRNTKKEETPESIINNPKSVSEAGIVIFELSSFQLWDLEKSPQTAVVLMIEPDHMDVHASMEEYIEAKAHIAKFQDEDDLLVYHPTNQYSAQIAAQSPAHQKQYLTQKGGAYVDGGQIIVGDVAVAQTKDVALIGEHNLENICAALATAWKYTQDIEAMQVTLKVFKGLPHRLEFVREVGGVKYFNDSQATGVSSCLAALRAFSQPTVLILGGSDKGLDITNVIEELDPAKHSVVLVGESSDLIEQAFKKSSFNAYTKLGTHTTMEEIVKTATSFAVEGGVVLLSPAHASFDMFENYQQRGDQFKQVVNSL